MADVSGDGKIDQEEFEGMMKMSRSTGGADNMPEDQIKALFKIFDENGDGRISATEMTHVLGYGDRTLPPSTYEPSTFSLSALAPAVEYAHFFNTAPAVCLAATGPQIRRCTDF